MHKNYYNENDPKAAAWLRELIKENLIAPGIVDERSICEVKPDDLSGFIQCHWFAGIGGWSYALRLAGWPDDEPVWTGSCPCQPFSCAGKGLGTKDSRHLWPQFRRLIRHARPARVFGEQVASAAGRQWLDGVCADLEALAYANAASDLCAAGVGAPHIRSRIYWMANTNRPRRARQGSAQPTQWRRDFESAWGIKAGWLAHGEGAGPSRGRPRGIQPIFGEGGSTRGLAITTCEQEQPSTTEGLHAKSCGDSVVGVALGDTNDAGSQRHGQSTQFNDEEERKTAQRHGAASSFWGDFEIIPFSDGKQRRIESGSFPLAHGIPGRVGLLRGYGNAIVPQVAAQFIQAATEAMAARNLI